MSTLRILPILLFLLCAISPATKAAFQTRPGYFMANKGQVKDQYGRPRKDIDFVFRAQEGLTIMVSRGKLTYYFTSSEAGICNQERVEMSLSGINAEGALIAEGGNGYVEHFYLNGAEFLQVPAAERICYKNVYEGIDWVVYISEGKLEYEFILNKKARPAAIHWEYKGAHNLSLGPDGALTWSSPMGTIREKAPESFTHKGNMLASAYRQNKNSFSYRVQQSGNLTIDPTVEWSTYQGGTGGYTYIYSSCTDHNGYLYFCGITSDMANIASTGAFSTTINGGADGFVSKFDTSGKHLWTTYYGGNDRDQFYNIQYNRGSVYCVGITYSTTGFSTPGVQQEDNGGGLAAGPNSDGIMAKFSANGMRVWAGFCGGKGGDYLSDLCIDAKGDLYTIGTTTSKTNIATAGVFQDTISQAKLADSMLSDAMLIKYDSNGRRVWGTYIGGFAEDYGESIFLKGTTLYLSGNTRSKTNVSTPSAYQPSTTGTASDAFLMKFDTLGKRSWGTYFGGISFEENTRVCMDDKGAVYLFGITNSTSGIASASAWQKTAGGKRDLFLAKFTGSGGLSWSTYYGGAEDDIRYYATQGGRISCDTSSPDNNVILFADTKSTGMATTDAYRKTLSSSGTYDALMAIFSASGSLTYSTYFGGTNADYATSVLSDRKNVYLCGVSTSTAGIATKGAFKDTLKNIGSGYITKFKPGNTSAIVESKSQKIDMSLSPNPATNAVRIQCSIPSSTDEEVSIYLLNIAGKTVQQARTIISGGQLDYTLHLFETLPPGIYTLQLHNSAGIAVQQLLKQ